MDIPQKKCDYCGKITICKENERHNFHLEWHVFNYGIVSEMYDFCSDRCIFNYLKEKFVKEPIILHDVFNNDVKNLEENIELYRMHEWFKKKIFELYENYDKPETLLCLFDKLWKEAKSLKPEWAPI